MTLLPLLTLALGTASAIARDPVAVTIQQGLLAAAPDGVTRIEVTSHRDRIASGCAIGEAKPLGQILGSGEITLKLDGRDARGHDCFGWSWAQDRVFGRALVTTRRLATGEALAGAYESRERELLAGHTFVRDAAPDAVSAYAIASNLILEPQNVRSPAQIPGRTIVVVLRSGDLIVETQGRTVPCALNAACAQLPSGKRVSGTWTNDRLEVTLP
jgi:hypothetical protein